MPDCLLVAIQAMHLHQNPARDYCVFTAMNIAHCAMSTQRSGSYCKILCEHKFGVAKEKNCKTSCKWKCYTVQRWKTTLLQSLQKLSRTRFYYLQRLKQRVSQWFWRICHSVQIDKTKGCKCCKTKRNHG